MSEGPSLKHILTPYFTSKDHQLILTYGKWSLYHNTKECLISNPGKKGNCLLTPKDLQSQAEGAEKKSLSPNCCDDSERCFKFMFQISYVYSIPGSSIRVIFGHEGTYKGGHRGAHNRKHEGLLPAKLVSHSPTEQTPNHQAEHVHADHKGHLK